jgi:hypothetical protein
LEQAPLVERLERLEQTPLVKRLEPFERLLSGVFKAMESLDPQVKRKFFPTTPDDSTGFEALASKTVPTIIVPWPQSLRSRSSL